MDYILIMDSSCLFHSAPDVTDQISCYQCPDQRHKIKLPPTGGWGLECLFLAVLFREAMDVLQNRNLPGRSRPDGTELQAYT